MSSWCPCGGGAAAAAAAAVAGCRIATPASLVLAFGPGRADAQPDLINCEQPTNRAAAYGVSSCVAPLRGEAASMIPRAGHCQGWHSGGEQNSSAPGCPSSGGDDAATAAATAGWPKGQSRRTAPCICPGSTTAPSMHPPGVRLRTDCGG
eukprot:TRINITY_DN18893_c0_g1_i4.p1 TRINITY_DN18893_c0_g1~~TRINITY_DN18893_c0_g1_i4.p1  ORF type:complete len:150 (+),score=10.74 TRINITY_DN18893_c0_g1_i4:48-497(+)